MALSKKKYDEMMKVFFKRPKNCKELPKTIKKPIRIILQLNSWDFRVYRIKPSGKVKCVEFELSPKQAKKPDIIDVKKSKFRKSISMTQESYEKVVEKFNRIIKKTPTAGIIKIKVEK